jgi:hypothetical protein
MHVSNPIRKYNMIQDRDAPRELGIRPDYKNDLIHWGDFQAVIKLPLATKTV